MALLTTETRIVQDYKESLAMYAKAGLKAKIKMYMVRALAQSGVDACMAMGFR